MKIATVQMNVVPGDIRRNLASMLSRIAEAKSSDVDLIVFPELATCGYLLGDMFEEDSFIEEIARANQTILEASKDTTIVWGSIVSDPSRKNEDGRIRKYNAACVAYDGKFLSNGISSGFVPKTNLPKYRIFDDARHFYPAAKFAGEKEVTLQGLLKPFSVIERHGKVASIGITICEDLWDDDYQTKPSQIYKHNGAKIIINISCSPWTAGKRRARERMLRSRFTETSLPILYVATVGLQNNGKNLVWFDGGSSFVSREGTIVWRARDNKESMTVIDTGLVRQEETLPNTDEIAEIHNAIIGAMKQFFAPFPKVIIGLSGGIDSAVTATLIVEAIGKERVIGINMPTRFNSDTTKFLAEKCAQNLGIAYRVAPIEGVLNACVEVVRGAGYRNLSQLSLENEQARIRGAGILALIAQEERGVFAATGNKTEIALNYFTLYGDGAGAAAFLGDLWKGQVYQLAELINQNVGTDLIPKEIIALRPSAELSAEQSVDLGGCDPIFYPYHDKLLQAFMERRRDPEWVLRSYMNGTLEGDLGCPAGTLLSLSEFIGEGKIRFIENLEWAWRQFHTSFKHVQTPPVFLASRRAFGFDYREFIGQAYFTDSYLKLKQQFLERRIS